MNHPTHCPKCDCLLDQGDVYEYFLEHSGDPVAAMHSAEMFSWSEETPVRFSRVVAIYCIERDATTHYECPECRNEVVPEGKVAAMGFRKGSKIK